MLEEILRKIFIDKKILTPQEWEGIVKESKEEKKDLISLVIDKGVISEEDIYKLLAEEFNLPYVELQDYTIPKEVLEIIPEELVRKYQVIPIMKIQNTVTVAVSNPLDIQPEEISRGKDFEIEFVISPPSHIKDAIERIYGRFSSLEEVVEEVKPEEEEEVSVDYLEKVAQGAPVVKLINNIITEAVRERASDIHIEPEEDKIRVRFRVDGVLIEVHSIPKYLLSGVSSRIKILSDLDIAERRRPQDGRFSVKVEGKRIDIRVSFLPTIYGENIVMRLLDKSSILLNLKDLGFSEQVYKKFHTLIHRPYGIIIVCGPTGSGKTTTLYSALQEINTPDKNIITLEDPVEYNLPLIRQCQVNTKIGLTFSQGLRSILRQDPDVILVGEIRDRETAQIAIQAALTGHLVFSTLHTNDAASAVVRLVDMGIEPFLVGSSLCGVLAQRLVRRLCKC
ncbi:MAG: type II secretion system protein GspE, partial [Candidatus Omnitrophica bacterium 4484_70.2]